MSEINTTINIHVDGNLYPLNKTIKEVSAVASQPSAIDEVAKPIGNGFKTGDILKKIKRAQVSSVAATKIGGVGGFAGASSQELHSVPVTKQSREDNIVYNEADLTKLGEAGRNIDLLAAEVADFIITGRELDLKELLAQAKTKSLAVKLHTAFDATTGLPTGAQPADGDGTFAKAITAIQGGRRNVAVANFDENIGTRLNLVRECINYLHTLGTPKNSTEELYLYSINGHLMTNIKVLASYADNVKLKEEGTQRFISVASNTMANMTGIVGYIDNGVKVVSTAQMAKETKYVISTDRVFARDLDPNQQYIGKVRDAAAVVMKDGSTKNLKPNERLLQFLQARTWAVRYPEEIFFLDQKA